MILKQKAIDIAKAFTKWGLWNTFDVTASQIKYNNAISILDATNVQSAIDELNTNTNELFVEVEIKGNFTSALGAWKRASMPLTYTRIGGYSPFAIKYINLDGDTDGLVMVGFGFQPTSKRLIVNVFNASSSSIHNGNATGTLILKKDKKLKIE